MSQQIEGLLLDVKKGPGKTKSRDSKGRKAAPKKKPPSKPRPAALCTVPDCGRPTYARRLCQTHHRQQRVMGAIGTIRPYHKRTADTVKLAGLRLSPACAQRLQQRALGAGTSLGATIAGVLEAWTDRGERRRKTSRNNREHPRE